MTVYEHVKVVSGRSKALTFDFYIDSGSMRKTVKHPWMGVFMDTHTDTQGCAYLMAAGYPQETAQKLGPAISTMLIGEDTEFCPEFVLQVVTPSADRVIERRFLLDEVQKSTIKHGPNTVTTCQSLYHWDEPTRTLASTFQSSNGISIAMDFVFNEDFTVLTKYRRAGDIEAVQEMVRLA